MLPKPALIKVAVISHCLNENEAKMVVRRGKRKKCVHCLPLGTMKEELNYLWGNGGALSCLSLH